MEGDKDKMKKIGSFIITLMAIFCLMGMNVFAAGTNDVRVNETGNITVAIGENREYFDITLNGDDTEKGKVYVALYKSGVLAEVQTYDAIQEKRVDLATNTFDTAKIMWWDNQNKPVCPQLEIADFGNGVSYAYVINAQYEKNAMGEACVRVLLLDRTGNIYDKYLVSVPTLYNFDENYGEVLEGLGIDGSQDRAVIDFTKYVTEDDRPAIMELASALVNNMIVYSANDAGYIKSITMPSKNESYKFTYDGAKSGKFNADYMELGDAIIGDTTYVFMVNAPEYAGTELADDKKCGVKVGCKLEHNAIYDYVAFDMDENDVAGAVVVLNTEFKKEEENDLTDDGAYAYVLNAQYVKDGWGKSNVRVLLLDRTGNIYDKYLASQTTLYNFDEDYGEVLEGLGENVEDRVSIDLTSYSENDRDGVKALASSLVNNMIVYSANDVGEVMSITMSSGDEDAKFTGGIMTSGEFNADYMELGDVIIGEDTYVFLVDAPEYAGTELADDKKCDVKVGYELEHNTIYDYVAFDMDENDVAGAVVVLGFDIGASFESTSIAVINKVEPDTGGVNDVYKVSYYMDGELTTAITDVNINSTALENAMCGDIYKFNIIDGVIIGATEVLTFTDRTNDEQMYAYVEDVNSTPSVTGAYRLETSAEINAEDTQGLFMGAVVEKKASGRYTIALAKDGDGALEFDNSELYRLSQDNANIYVYDPMQTGDAILSIGSLADIYVDEKLYNGDYEIEDEDGNAVDSPAFGMADYVFVRQYDGEVMDIVIYKNYEFNYDVTKR